MPIIPTGPFTLTPTCGPEAFAVFVDGDRVGTVAHPDGQAHVWRHTDPTRVQLWSADTFPTAADAAQALTDALPARPTR